MLQVYNKYAFVLIIFHMVASAQEQAKWEGSPTLVALRAPQGCREQRGASQSTQPKTFLKSSGDRH